MPQKRDTTTSHGVFIPRDTCPIINEVVTALDVAISFIEEHGQHEHHQAKDVMREIQSALKTLEDVREANFQLRQASKEYRELYESALAQIDTLETEVENLKINHDNEVDDLTAQVATLEDRQAIHEAEIHRLKSRADQESFRRMIR